MRPIFTIGHSTLPTDEFLALLRASGVERLIDVRRWPHSPRNPQFEGKALGAALAAAGIEYAHEPDLGGRRKARPDSPHVYWESAAFRGYADHMETPAFQAALARLRTYAAERTMAIMCAEAVPWRCHRRLIADALTAGGAEVRNIFGGRVERHEINPHARVSDGGGLVYDVVEPTA